MSVHARLFSIAAGLTLAISASAHAANYYVAPCGNDAWLGVVNNCIGPLGAKQHIQAAIDVAVNGDTIFVMPGTYFETLDLDGKAITIIGLGGPEVTIVDAQWNDRVVYCNSLEGPGTVLQGLKFTHGWADNLSDGGGGALIALASPTFNGCVFQENTTGQWGGAVKGIAASPTFNNCQFTGNEGIHGGAMYFSGGLPVINGCTINANNASLWGGGVVLMNTTASVTGNVFGANLAVTGGGLYVNGGDPVIDSNTFSWNDAYAHGAGLTLSNMSGVDVTDCVFQTNEVFAPDDAHGGAVHVYNSTATFDGCTFNSNFAAYGGGAIFSEGASDVSITSTTFDGNTSGAINGGGAIFADGGTLNMIGGTINNNSSGGMGGAVYTINADASFAWVGFEGNSASVNGGAIRAHQGSLTLGLCGFTSNQSVLHGGAIAAAECDVEIDGSVFNTNEVTGDYSGGAIYAVDGTLDADSCLWTGNSAPWHGGGVHLDSVDNAYLFDCTFTNNSATIGGALRLDSGVNLISECEFTGNQAVNVGGAVSSLGYQLNTQFESCQFVNNTSLGGGGAFSTQGKPRIIGCLFSGNTADYAGGVVSLSAGGHPMIIASRFEGNQVTENGAAVGIGAGGSATIINCIVTANIGPADAGALWEDDDGIGQFALRNCAVVDNTGGGIRADDPATTSTVFNTVVWGNTNGGEFIGFAPDVKFCNVEGGMAGDGNIDATPMFVNAAVGNYELTAGSPCVDAGANWGLPADTLDLDGDGLTTELFPYDYNGMPRIADDLGTVDTGCGAVGTVDIGPYETAGVAVHDVVPGDTNGDGFVDVTDLLELLAAWGPCVSGCCPADFDLSGGVDVVDLLTLLGSWG